MPLFFVHIPKTAGTSFRLGAECYFGNSLIVYDYGKHSASTSSLVRDYLYSENPDHWLFLKKIDNIQAAMVGGHVNANRFVSLFGVEKTLTFLREPLQRMASEYAHFVRHYDYNASFHDFYSRPIMHNRQSKILHGVDLEAMGFVGLTERYVESLELLNAGYGIEIPQREDNRGKQSLKAEHEISPEDEAEFKRINKRDMQLYEQAAALFDDRYRLYRAGQPWAHARMVEANAQRVAGWAWWAGDVEEAVAVEVWINGEHKETVLAVNHCPGLCRLLPPRGGYVGFQLPVKLLPGDRVQCRVEHTGQWFPSKPRRVLKPDGQ